MTTYSLPSRIRGLIVDLDSTLYRNEAYAVSQTEDQLDLLAADLGWERSRLDAVLAQARDAYRAAHGNRDPSLGNLLLGALDYPIAASVDLRRRALRPERYLRPDGALRTALITLQTNLALVLLTNNPSDIARRTLTALGVGDVVTRVIGLEVTGQSKPHPAPFDRAYEALALDPREVVSVGDRFAVDLETPLARGSGAVLVENMDDVYLLPLVLRTAKS